MADFEIHAKKLGRIAFHPSAAVAYTQDPDTFGEYVRQVRRWILGFWQTVRRHRFHTSVFWAALAVFIIELIISSLMFVLLIPLLVPRCWPPSPSPSHRTPGTGSCTWPV